MHMVATNLCVWLRVIVEETIREIHEHVELRPGSKYHRGNHSASHDSVVSPPTTTTIHLSFVEMGEESGEGPSYAQMNNTS